MSYVELEAAIGHADKVPVTVRAHRPRIPPANLRSLANRFGCNRGGESVSVPCHWCGSFYEISWPIWAISPRFMTRGVGLTIDHLLPYAKGGTHETSNLTLACGFCNSARRDKTPEEFIGRQA